MAITIDWGTKVINVPKADTTLVQLTPTEIRELDLNAFRLTLKDLEDGVDGMPFPDTHRHNPPVTVGGVELARVVEIINGYTVTFEDGQYAVNLFGANSNVGDVVNVNQVSIRSANSAGLVNSADIEFIGFGGGVHVDLINGVSGTVDPIGKLRMPVNNFPDAVLIATRRGFIELKIIANADIVLGDDIGGFVLRGQNVSKTTITVYTDAETEAAEFRECTIQGVFDNAASFFDCTLMDIQFVEATIHRCQFCGTVTASGDLNIIRSWDGSPESAPPPVIDFNGSGANLMMRDYHGDMVLRNKTGTGTVEINYSSGGTLIIEDTCTNGLIRITGAMRLIDNSGPGCIVDTTNVTNLTTITSSVWDEVINNNILGLTAGEILDLTRKLLNNRLELEEGDVDNWILFDDDDLTELLKWSVTDKSGLAITIRSSDPARRTRGVAP